MMKDSLGDRMKLWEKLGDHTLPPKVPVIVRLDGRAFHTLTRKCEKPYDYRLMNIMADTTRYLMKETGAVFAYTQSDEISLCLWDGRRKESQPWFGNRLSKIVSISASMASVYFSDRSEWGDGFFDSRVFPISEEDVSNYFIWRQLDWIRNSISMLAHSLYSHKELQDKKRNEQHEMIWRKGHNWADLPRIAKNGTFFHYADEDPLYIDLLKTRANTEGFFNLPREEVNHAGE